MIYTAGGRSWTLMREDTARRLSAIGNASTSPRRTERVLRKLHRETARPSHRRLVALAAVGDLLDTAAADCFADPVAATDVVRWNQMRRQPHQVARDLERGPEAFGALRIEREATRLWASLPEPRHTHIPAWNRFRDAARRWLEVHEGREWLPPPTFPPPPQPPVAPMTPVTPAARPEPVRPAPPPAAPSAPRAEAPPPPRPRGRSSDPGFSR